VSSDDYESNLADVIGFLKKCGFPLENCFISFFSPIFSAYINCGLDPLPASIKISKDDLIATRVNNSGEERYRLQLKFQWGIRSDTTKDGEEEEETVNNEESSMQQPKRQMRASQMAISQQEPKRTKERTIKYIIEKVSQWRKLYNGYMNENHELVRMSLEEAAEKVGVSKKSLDDYLSQLR